MPKLLSRSAFSGPPTTILTICSNVISKRRILKYSLPHLLKIQPNQNRASYTFLLITHASLSFRFWFLMTDENRHLLIRAYQMLRTARMSALYYENRLWWANFWNFIFEIAIAVGATSSGVAAWA